MRSATAFVPAYGVATARVTNLVSVGAHAPAEASQVVLPCQEGPAGPPGKDGKDGVGLSLSFAFGTPALTWTVSHGLNRFPAVTIVDTAGDQVAADVAYIDANTIRIAFGSPSAGIAYLN